ncbi:MAG: OmpA family protein [Deltaproteobacteria bacterium]|nr:OmpA family protein [Deltaproteobacteria bacterium]
MKKSFLAFGALAGILFLGLNGCASKDFVKEQISQSINPVHLQAEKNRAQIAALKEMTTGLNDNQQKASIAAEKALTRAEKALARSREALTHAEEAGKLARGKLLFYVTFTDESVHFGFDVSSLSDEAKSALDSFAEHVKAENKNAYIEIQGHTDSIGTNAYNLRLGMARAEAVKRYLHTQHHIALHRMSTFSYGESIPIVENDTTQNRAKNRRITIEVLE